MGNMRVLMSGLLLLPLLSASAVGQTRFSQSFEYMGKAFHADLQVSDPKTATKGFVAGGSQSSNYYPAGSIYREVTVRISDARGKAPKGDWIVRRESKALDSSRREAPLGNPAVLGGLERYRGPLFLTKGAASFFLAVDAREFKGSSPAELAASLDFEFYNLEEGAGVAFLKLLVTHSRSGIDVLEAVSAGVVATETSAQWTGARTSSAAGGQ